LLSKKDLKVEKKKTLKLAGVVVGLVCNWWRVVDVGGVCAVRKRP
jgi:hypothetical protein